MAWRPGGHNQRRHSTERIIMADDKVTVDNSATDAVKQQNDKSWPVPGDEGYVIPDGTPQAAQQLEQNKRAAADRAAAGSTVHGAPAATPGPQLFEQAEAAQARAENYSGPTIEERDAGTTKAIQDGFAAATDKAETSDQPVSPTAVPANRTADDSKSTTKR
jgi:hypothetical protein